MLKRCTTLSIRSYLTSSRTAPPYLLEIAKRASQTAEELSKIAQELAKLSQSYR
ncbi:MAG: hypothetical protein QW348_06860 [Ignisphaera sp.]